jgi:D-ribose pyranose/furanose isomerase RbsD
METKEKNQEINWWKQKVQELRVQLHLGVSEAANLFEDQKAEIGRWASATKKTIEDDGSATSKKLKTRLEELQVQAALGKAETKEKLAEQRKKMQHTIAEAQVEASQLAQDVDIRAKHLGAEAGAQLDHWHTKLDLLKLQLHLGAKETAEEWQDQKGELKEMLTDLDTKIEKLSDETSDSWKDFKADLSKSWGKVRDKLS